MKKKDLISLSDLSTKEILDILTLARRLKKAPFSRKGVFKDKILALLFQKPSNRTRVSFEAAMVHLGGHVLYLSPREIAMGTRETVKDVACVISRYVECIVARVYAHQDIVELARYSRVPVINGLSDMDHPCQAISDIFTIQEKMRRLRKVTLSYIGDGNNVLNSLLMACAKTGVNMKIATPEGYRPKADKLEEAAKIAKKNKASIELVASAQEAIRGSDVVYTDVWVSMGDEAESERRLKDFAPYQINRALMREAKDDIVVMHCLPAHRGEEITEDVLDSKNSIVYDQAENRMHVQKAVLLKLLR